jgi:hypothetical protein
MSATFYASKTSVVILLLATVVLECAAAQQSLLFVGLAGAWVAEPVEVAMCPEGAENCSAAEKMMAVQHYNGWLSSDSRKLLVTLTLVASVVFVLIFASAGFGCRARAESAQHNMRVAANGSPGETDLGMQDESSERVAQPCRPGEDRQLLHVERDGPGECVGKAAELHVGRSTDASADAKVKFTGLTQNSHVDPAV